MFVVLTHELDIKYETSTHTHTDATTRLQHAATRNNCNTLQHAATRCNTLQHAVRAQGLFCITMQHTATRCNTLLFFDFLGVSWFLPLSYDDVCGCVLIFCMCVCVVSWCVRVSCFSFSKIKYVDCVCGFNAQKR